jgi:magnesium transporter
VLAALESAAGARVLTEMAPLVAARALEAAPAPAAVEIVAELGLDVAAALLRRVSDTARRRLLPTGDARRGRALRELLQHAADSAGGLMDPMVLALPATITAGDALERVRSAPENALYYLYLLGDGNRLIGVVNHRELMLAAPKAPLVSFMTERPDAILANAGRDAIAAHPAWQRVHALPVVDRNGIFLGAIRYQTVRRIERELGRSARAADPRLTATALGELYGIGVGGLAALAATAVRGPGGRREGGE